MAADPGAARPITTRPLADLVAALETIEVVGDAAVEVTDVTYRSGDVRAGALFFCVRGTRTDGHLHAADAVAAGAVALVVERRVDAAATQVVVPEVRAAMGPVSAEFFAHPSSRMRVVGVTGTNGKTTTTYLLESILRANGNTPGVIGTTGVRVAGRPRPFARTTPEAPDLQRLLAEMAAAGVDAVAMEVSSHGLDQHRVDGTRYACAIFTNLSQDHLDYHPTMEAYFEAKARLFTPELSDRGVVNGDAEEGRVLAARATIPMVTFGLGSGVDVRAEDVEVGDAGVSFRVGDTPVRSPLRGTFNVYNCLGAFAAAVSIGIDTGTAAQGLAALRGVPGRLEPVDVGQPFQVLVDYAHTPDSLENVLRATRELTVGQLIVVFGCGGDRDRGKRPLMGRAATSLADLSVITSDNPRSERPEDIVADVERGAREGGGAYLVEVDRRAAIALALAEAAPGDVVLIAGKGHETGQELAGWTVPFDDRIVAEEELRADLEART